MEVRMVRARVQPTCMKVLVRMSIQLIAIDDDGAESVEKNLSVVIPQNNPLVNFMHSVAKRVVQFNASRSVSPTASILSYKWDFGDGNVTTTA